MKRVVLLKADGTREVLTPEKKPTLEQMQKWVGGDIEPIHRDTRGRGIQFDGQAAVLVLNEEGRLHGLALNKQACQLFDFDIVGDCFVLQGWRL